MCVLTLMTLFFLAFSCSIIPLVCHFPLYVCVCLFLCVCTRTPIGVRGRTVPQQMQPVRVEGRVLVHLYYQHCGRPASLRGGSPKPQDQVSEWDALGSATQRLRSRQATVAGNEAASDTGNETDKQTVNTQRCFLMSI